MSKNYMAWKEKKMTIRKDKKMDDSLITQIKR